MDINGKKISIIGAVRSGVGAAKLAKKLGGLPFVSDLSEDEKIYAGIAALKAEGINFETGSHSDKVYDCELMVISPGVPSKSSVVQNALSKGIEVISELEFASWYCRGRIIAVTGTNGKTTTTSLCSYTLNNSGYKCYEAGNIGLAFSEIVLGVKENEYVALETSSFQLDHIKWFKPFISVIINITPDHLDRYDNKFENYVASKMNIVRNQDDLDFCIINCDDSRIPGLTNDKVNKICFSVNRRVQNGSFISDNQFQYSNDNNAEPICNADDLLIKGLHNKQNALAVLSAVKIVGCDNESIKKSFAYFPGVEHRLEFVRRLDSVEYINDSKATNVDSVWYALQSFKEPIYLILGGKDKGNDYSRIESLVKGNVKKIYAIGSSAGKIFEFFKNTVTTEIKSSLKDCVNSARSEAEPNSVVLLSPACASFDMFDNYEHRGKVFKQEVMSLN
ncbi:MAG: UDP-N-acetylmuramoyl-L-alanine--D-glutamate ligase [Melioribacteraceae bacterium]|nr:UDP-N-acetylmuramoyl-L-alanine--D-glutamate ligase [Melioribacteraceae bacterium]